jgi:hypothetical protein
MDVKVGQVWADNDPRVPWRKIRVDEIVRGYAMVTVVEDPTSPKCVGKQRRIRLDRFRPTSTGYRLVSDAKGDV